MLFRSINFLKEKGYKIEEPERFLKVKFSDRKFVLLEDEEESSLVETWDNDNDLNNFEYFMKNNDDVGHFWIGGNVCKFEFKYKGEWLKCDKLMEVRFLRWIQK